MSGKDFCVQSLLFLLRFLHKKAVLPTGRGDFCGDWGRLWGRYSSGCSSGCRSRCWCGCSCGQRRRSQGGQRNFGRRRSWSFGGQRSPFYHNIFGSGFSAGSYGDGVGFVCKSFVGRGHKQHGLSVAQNFATAAAPFKCGSRVGRGEAGHKNYIIPAGTHKRFSADAQTFQLQITGGTGGLWCDNDGFTGRPLRTGIALFSLCTGRARSAGLAFIALVAFFALYDGHIRSSRICGLGILPTASILSILPILTLQLVKSDKLDPGLSVAGVFNPALGNPHFYCGGLLYGSRCTSAQ